MDLEEQGQQLVKVMRHSLQQLDHIKEALRDVLNEVDAKMPGLVSEIAAEHGLEQAKDAEPHS